MPISTKEQANQTEPQDGDEKKMASEKQDEKNVCMESAYINMNEIRSSKQNKNEEKKYSGFKKREIVKQFGAA